MINLWESVNAFSEARSFCDRYQVQGPVLVDETGFTAELLDIRGVPTNVFVDEVGTVRHVGASTPAELHRVVTDLLGHQHWSA